MLEKTCPRAWYAILQCLDAFIVIDFNDDDGIIGSGISVGERKDIAMLIDDSEQDREKEIEHRREDRVAGQCQDKS